MAIKKVPKNYDTTLNRRKQHLNDIVDALNNITDVVANPEGSSTEELKTLKVGDTIYAVNKPSFDTIKTFKITIANGGQYNTNKPIIEFYDDGGQKANITTSDYAVECDKTYAGNAAMTEVCSIQTPETPGTFTYTFVNDFNTLKYHIMKLTRGGTFVNDIAKNIKIELSVDGTNFITIYDETSITWSDAVTSHSLDIATGEEASTLLPIVTSADNGNVLGVVNGVWDKMTLSSKGTKIFTTTGSGANITLVNATGIDVLQAITDGYNVVINNSGYDIRYYFAFRSGSGNSHINFIAFSGVSATSVTIRMYDINGNSSSNSVTSTSYTINFAT